LAGREGFARTVQHAEGTVGRDALLHLYFRKSSNSLHSRPPVRRPSFFSSKTANAEDEAKAADLIPKTQADESPASDVLNTTK
jgi:hypothetical protein